ncbi:hypothetical protein MIZ01_2527 [Sideroxyarcus emersonii]|uniref:Lipoprotein n=1 Tax=Sideroxyarcus emersonii TaxID=2764705 RepID=A0AAN1XC27_9PROT|nr:hypothetical protein [Sideroxyarcus emersonii]BCK88721.1 hypothetical protein MIZ01_2527 [Sideroxyarcus emersonii]
MNRTLVVMLLCLSASACGTYGESRIAQVDSKTGLLQSDREVAVARVVVSKKLALGPYQDLVVISKDDFSPMNSNFKTDNVKQLRALNYFRDVIGFDDLQQLVVSNNLQNKVTTLSNWGGVRDLYRSYKPFLVIHFKCIESGDIFYRLTVTNPDTLENVFVSEVEVHSKVGYGLMGLFTLGAGMNSGNRCTGYDSDTRYPLFNSLILWINQNK